MQIGDKFFEGLKKYILEKSPDTMSTLIKHYENLVDYADVIATLLVDVHANGVEFYYRHDDTGGYTDGTIEVNIYGKNRRYDISLLRDDRSWGYCECQPEDEGYDPVKKCCGNVCDWTAPSFEVSLVTTLGGGSYKGIERDMWEAENKWDEHTKGHRIQTYEKKLRESEEYADYYARQTVAWEEEIAKLKEEA